MALQKILWSAIFLLLNSPYPEQNGVGSISGTIPIQDTWEPIIYLSYIDSFDAMNSMSAEMIVASDTIDSLGGFVLDLDFLPLGDHLVRLHLVKKGDPPTSLVIGGKMENHWFLIVNNKSVINLVYSEGLPISENLTVSGSPFTEGFHQISALRIYPNSLDYESSILKKEFVVEAVNENLRKIADSSSNPLIALYALKSSDYKTNEEESPEYYESFLKKWDAVDTPYFQEFREEIKDDKIPWRILLYGVLTLFAGVVFGKVLGGRKKLHVKKLSVQERKIFELLKRGASNQQISDECHIELSTVKSHVSSIFSKLKIKSRKEAIDWK